MTANSFYNRLQQQLDTRTPIPALTNIKITMGNTPKTIYNASGNIRITTSIPKDSDTPNYCENLLNLSVKPFNALFIILNMIINKDFICEPTIANLISIPGTKHRADGDIDYVPIPAVDLKKELDLSMNSGHQWHTWNLNYNRNYTIDDVKVISAHLINKLNAIIHYVITNDIHKPDDQFRKLVADMFRSSDGQIYSFSHNTLLLPALINYAASKNNKLYAEHSCRRIGLVVKDSGLFPKNGFNKFNDETKWIKSGVKIPPGVIAPYCLKVNGKQQLYCSAYNYPFCDAAKGNYNWRPTTVNISQEQVDMSLVHNVQFTFEKDNYAYSDPKDDTSFAITTGDRVEPTAEYGYRTLRSIDDTQRNLSMEYVRSGEELLSTCHAIPRVESQHLTDKWK